MKKLFKIVFASLLFCGLATACSDSDDAQSPYLEVNRINIAGTWKLSSWNGIEQGEATYMYITFDRRDLTFEMYHNFDSGQSRRITGVYEIVVENGERTFITGRYDHDGGDWEHDYFVDKLTQKEMTWTITDNSNDVSVYTRTDKVPEDIVNGSRCLE